MNHHFIILSLLILLLAGCSGQGGHDSSFIPYRLKGMDVYVYDDEANKEHYVGYASGNYTKRRDVLNQCQVMAYNFAEDQELSSWSYICCTVTSNSSCATKVR